MTDKLIEVLTQFVDGLCGLANFATRATFAAAFLPVVFVSAVVEETCKAIVRKFG